MRSSDMAVIDHLVLAVPDLDAAIADFELSYGVRPAIGGRHQGLGTHNALISFGESYLELIAPDPSQPDPDSPRPFGVDDIDAPRLATFAVRPDTENGETVEILIAACQAASHDTGPLVSMSRQAPDGSVLTWRLTFPTMTHDGLVPFLIDWGGTVNPAATAPGGVSLIELSGATSDPAGANAVLRVLALAEFARPVGASHPGLAANISARHSG
ncbi:MAG: VOC family protein [Ilumatobacter sp.]|nr:VOC family protein [Ilumatobacter sp.]